MAASLPGETLAARFPGTCVLCRGKFLAGAQIHYLKSTGAEHLDCAQRAADALEGAAELLSWSCDESLAPPPGQTYRVMPGDHHQHAGRIVVPLVTRWRFIAQEGESLGLRPGRDRGWLATVTARPATGDELAALERQEEAAREAARQAARRAACWAQLRSLAVRGTSPARAEPTGRLWPATTSRYDDERLQIDEAAGVVWLLVYNGRDGDCWAQNNYGPHMAWVFPLDAEARALLVELGALDP